MEAIIKRYFWVINLIFLLLAAWLLASSFNVVIAHKLRAVPEMDRRVTQKKVTSYSPQEVKDNQVIVRLNLFGSAMSLPIDTVENGPELDESGAEELVDGAQSSLRANLVGTVVASDRKWSMAIITDLNKSETGIYRVDDTLLGEATVAEILPQRIYVVRNAVREYIDLREKGGAKGAAGLPQTAAAPQAAAGADASLGDGIKKLTEDSYIIQRSEIDKTLSNLNSIAMQARIVPSFVNGEANGFKLFAIRPGSLYSKIGIQNGDVIQKINGFPMNSPDKALEIYQKLKGANNIDVEVVRRGQNKKLSYQVQ